MRFSGRVRASQLAQLLGDWQSDRAPDYVVLADRIRQSIQDGSLPLMVRMPAERELSDGLSVSRGTVGAAYDRLRERGFLASRRGIGSWTVTPPGAYDGHGASTPLTPHPEGFAIDLALASPSALTEPVARAATRAAERLPDYLSGHGYDLLGLQELRERIAMRYTARGLPTGADQIAVTGGGQFALMLALRAVTQPGDRVLVEHPTYPNALEAIRRQGGKPVPVPFSSDSWNLSALASTLREAAPKVCYLMPDVHNPTGHVMSEEQRSTLVSTLQDSGAVTIVDESLCDIRFDVEPGDAPTERPLAAHARGPGADTFVTIGSLSKLYWGGLRIGWIRASRETTRRIAGARVSIDVSTPVLSQLVALELLDAPREQILDHLARIRDRRDHLCELLRRHTPGWAFTTPRGGLSLWVDLGIPQSQNLVIAAAERRIALATGPQFGVGGAFQSYLRLPFVQSADVLSEAVPALATAWGRIAEQHHPARARRP